MSIEPNEDIDDDEDEEIISDKPNSSKNQHVNIQKYFSELAEKDNPQDPFEDKRVPTIADRERGTYNEKRQKLQLSPGVRYDPFAEGSQTPDIHSVRRTTAAVMRETQVLNEKKELEYKLKEKAKAGELKALNISDNQTNSDQSKKKRRWDQTTTETNLHEAPTPHNLLTKDMETPMHHVWDPTPGHAESGAITPPDLTPGNLSETPKVSKSATRRRWDETPKTERISETTPHLSGWAETPKVERLDDDTIVISKQASLNLQANVSAASKVIKN